MDTVIVPEIARDRSNIERTIQSHICVNRNDVPLRIDSSFKSRSKMGCICRFSHKTSDYWLAEAGLRSYRYPPKPLRLLPFCYLTPQKGTLHGSALDVCDLWSPHVHEVQLEWSFPCLRHTGQSTSAPPVKSPWLCALSQQPFLLHALHHVSTTAHCLHWHSTPIGKLPLLLSYTILCHGMT